MTPVDPTTRQAARWATAVAVPLTLVVGGVLFAVLRTGPAAPAPAGPPRAQVTTPVDATAAPLSGPAADVCPALLRNLPATVRDLPRREVTAGRDQNAAYGDPPLLLACGVPAPSFPPTDTLFQMSGAAPGDPLVCWHASETSTGSVWTTVDRTVPVRVTVPAGYEQPAQWANEFSSAVAEVAPLTTTVPDGCGG